MALIVIVVILAVIGIIYYIIKKCRESNAQESESFSNVENSRIIDIFAGAQKEGKTYPQIKKEIKKRGIDFHGDGTDGPSFKNYYELYKNYNNNKLTPELVDTLRNY